MASRDRTVAVLLDRHGETFCAEIGIRIESGTPMPLFGLLCAAMLYGARIEASLATEAAVSLRRSGLRTAQKMADSSWQTRVHALNEGGYTRYREQGATRLGELAGEVVDRYRGDLRRLRAAADRDPAEERRLLGEFTGIGPVAVDIFVREVQATWGELAPFADDRALGAASDLGLGSGAAALRRLVASDPEFARLVAALVRTELAGDADEILADAGG